MGSTNKDIKFIIEDLTNLKDSYLKEYGEIEIAEELNLLINTVVKNGITQENRMKIQNEYEEIFYSFPIGHIREYQDSEYVDIIEKIIGVSYISENEKMVREKFYIKNLFSELFSVC